MSNVGGFTNFGVEEQLRKEIASLHAELKDVRERNHRLQSIVNEFIQAFAEVDVDRATSPTGVLIPRLFKLWLRALSRPAVQPTELTS